MLPERNIESSAAQQMFAELRRRKKFYAEKRLPGGQQFAAKKMRLTARCRDDSDRLSVIET